MIDTTSPHAASRDARPGPAPTAGRSSGIDAAVGDNRPYGGTWNGPIFVLTERPGTRCPPASSTFLGCGSAEAVPIGLPAAGERAWKRFADYRRRLLEPELSIRSIDLYITQILLGRVFAIRQPGTEPIRLDRASENDPTSLVNVRYRPNTTTESPG